MTKPWRTTSPIKRSPPLTELRNSALAEVLTSSIVGLTAETLRSGKVVDKPRFGSFIKVESPENKLDIFAVVLDVVTNPPDSVHRPAALGLSRERLREEQPHIFSLLKTEIKALIIGFAEEGKIYQHLPPQPPEVHDFVYRADDKAICALSAEFDFLRLLATTTIVPVDEIISACIREAARVRKNEKEKEAYLLEAGRAVSQLFRSDYERMVAIVRKLKPNLL